MSRSAVAAMTAYTLELREAEIKLNQNESPFDMPREWKERILARLAERPWNLYPDFEATALRAAIAEARGLQPENVLVGNGSNELLAAAIGAFVGPGTPVIFPRPTFTLYEKLVTIAGGLAVPIEFEPHSGLLPLEEMLAAIARYDDAVVIVCSPNNPTGGVLPDGGLDALIESGAMVLLDQAYGDFAGDPSPSSRFLMTRADAVTPVGHGCAMPNSGVRSSAARPYSHGNLVTFRTFSKAWGLAALRVGWCASAAENCREIRKVKLPYSLNVLSAAIAEEALRDPARRDATVAHVIAERERLFAAMRTIPRIEVFPTKANFITFRTRRPLFDPLVARGILVRDVSSYPRLQGCLRVSIGTAQQNDSFLAALKEIA